MNSEQACLRVEGTNTEIVQPLMRVPGESLVPEKTFNCQRPEMTSQGSPEARIIKIINFNVQGISSDSAQQEVLSIIDY